MKGKDLILLTLVGGAVYLFLKKKSGTTATYTPKPTITLPTTQGTLTHGYNNLPNPWANVQIPGPLTQWLTAMTTQAQFNAFFQSKRPVNVSSHNNNVTKTYFIDANHFISIDLDNHGGAMDFALVKAAYPLTGNATPPIWVAFFQNGPTAGPTTVMGTSQSIV